MSTDPAPKPIPVPATAPITISPSATSKKRTYEEIEGDSMGGTLPPSRTPGISPTTIYGGRIPRIDPLTGTATSLETHNGTWLEDQLAMKLQPGVEGTSVQTTDSDSKLPQRKVQRRDNSSDSDLAMATNPIVSSKATVADPTIDQYTHLLGIGWTYVGEGSGLAAMARGFSRYIENNYPLTDAVTVLKSKSLEAYLVKASQGYFLFQEDLAQGRLVASTWEDTVANLQMSPIRFSVVQPLLVAKTPDTGRETNNALIYSVVGGEVQDTEMN